jgi:pyrroline-5-carboxylate reductase
MSVKKISFIGAGNMTKAIIEGLVANGYKAEHIMASNPSRPKLDILANELNIHITQDNAEAIAFADVVIMAVKPQLMETVCKDMLSRATVDDKLVISIAAGISAKRFSEMLGGHERVVRVMPNTPSSLGQGMSGIYAPSNVTQQDAEFTAYIMDHVGKTLIVAREDDIDTVIAAAGSSPAYFFLIAQCMQEEAIKMGLTADDARLLVQQAMLGSAQMMVANPDVSLETLRKNVTSKGGTTAEAVASLQKNNIAHILSDAMRSAVKRASQMTQEF